MDRDDDGRPRPPQAGSGTSLRELFRLSMFYAGIHDPAVVARLWREAQA